MYFAIIVYMIRSQQSVVVIYFLEELVIGTKQLQTHAGGGQAHDHLQLPLITMYKNKILTSIFFLKTRRDEAMASLCILSDMGWMMSRLTLNSAIVILLINLFSVSKGEMVLVILRVTTGSLTTVTPLSIMTVLMQPK